MTLRSGPGSGEADGGAYGEVIAALQDQPRVWLVTGAAGFIGSHLVESLLRLGQKVRGLDNFATGSEANLVEVEKIVGPEAWGRFEFIRGDIRDLGTCHEACAGVEVVLHEAALGSVPRSIQDPIATHGSNLSGFLNILVAARDAGVRRFVFAASSSTYGDHPDLPKIENRIGRPLSPYAVTKYANELYARVFFDTYHLETVGLRYFNVFGARQDPGGAYAAVIPRWVANLLDGTPCVINGDGETSRDFSHVSNVVQANLLAAVSDAPVGGEIYNVGCGGRTTLNELFDMIRDGLVAHHPAVVSATPHYAPFRAGDVRHSEADITKISRDLGYRVSRTVPDGLAESLRWYLGNLSPAAAS